MLSSISIVEKQYSLELQGCAKTIRVAQTRQNSSGKHLELLDSRNSCILIRIFQDLLFKSSSKLFSSGKISFLFWWNSKCDQACSWKVMKKSKNFNDIEIFWTFFGITWAQNLIFYPPSRYGSNSGDSDGDYDDLIYATFSTPGNSISGSAVCAFRLQDIIDAFNGPFKEQRDMGSNWMPVPEHKVSFWNSNQNYSISP